MDFNEEIQLLSTRAKKSASLIKTEEATKQAFIIPFIKALGYDVYDPIEVVPEFTADVGMKKGEKVDYAIMCESHPIILVECKWCGKDLCDKDAAQLYRYFSVTDSRIAILTNGIIYRFYTDLEKTNTMDSKSFLEFDLMNINEDTIPELKKLSKTSFDLDNVISAASDLKYKKEIKNILSGEIENPSDDFTRFFASRIYSGRITQNTLEDFRKITRRSLKDFINGEINARLKLIMSTEKNSEDFTNLESEQEKSNLDISKNMSKKQRDDEKIETTQDEANGFLQVMSALEGEVEEDRVIWRDSVSYFSILLDDNNRKPICRLYFNTSQKYIALFDNDNKKLEKKPIMDISEISNFKQQLINSVRKYDK